MTGPVVVRAIDRPAADLVAAFEPFGVADLYEASGRAGLVDPAIRPVLAGVRICGPAVTSLNQPQDNLMVHAAVELCSPGDVLVVATTEPGPWGMVGELLATQARARGVAGIVIDGGVRDTAALRRMALPVWARAITAAGTRKANPGWVNLPVALGGVRVAPGDLIVADDDGVVAIPRERLAAVLEAARARIEHEDALRARYAAGESSMDIHGLRSVLAERGTQVVDGPQPPEGDRGS